jgi:D-alanyl-D-alanine carboxypeptidase
VLHEAFTRQPFDPDFRIPAQALIDILRDQAPLFAAGQGFAYSESGYLLAGLALERECGCHYYDEVERRFLQPLKLDHTHPAITRDVPNLVNGHIGDKLAAIGFPAETVADGKLLFNPATEWTGGGLYSNAADLVRWSKALYEGKALRGSYLDELLAKDAGAYEHGEGYGLGVRVMRTTLGMAYGHAGEFPGYVSLVLYFPDSGRAIALQANTALTDAGFLKDAALRLLQVADQ